MNRELLNKLIEQIVAEVARRVRLAERQAQHPEQVLVLLSAPVAYPKELKKLLAAQFGEGYTPVSFTQACGFSDEALLSAEALGERELLRRVTEAKTVILVGPTLTLLEQVARGRDEAPLAYLLIRSVLWKKDVRLYLDFEPPKFRRNTFLEGVAASIDTLRQMNVADCPYYTGDAAQSIAATLVTEADVLAAAQTAKKTICARVGAIVTPAARDALNATGVILHYEGGAQCN